MKFDPRQKIYVICNTGAMGDTICSMVIMKTLSDRGHIEKLFVDKRYLDLYKLVFPHDIIVSLETAMTVIPKDQVTPDIPQSVINPRTGEASFLNYPIIPNIPVVYSMKPSPTSIHCHLIDCFSMSISECILKETQKDYPRVSAEKLPNNKLKGEKYIVLAYGATVDNRRMLPEVFEGLKQYFLERDYKVVTLGKRDHLLQAGDKLTRPMFDGVSFEGCIDLIDKTTIPEALSIINDAKMIVGLDGGLIHLAGMTDTPIVASYTEGDPYYLIPYRNGIKGHNVFVVEPDSECKYCKTETFETYGIDFLKCNAGTKECMNSLTLDKYISQIEKIMRNKT